MSLQFYLGPAGSGKTFRMMDDIAARLREDASPRSAPLYLLLPEQATAQAESTLLRQPGIEACARALVVSFRRLADMVLRQTGGASESALDEQGRQMLLRALVSRHRTRLKIFGRSCRQAGFLGRLSNFLGELAQFRYTAADLQARYLELQQAGDAESLFGRKLHDLALVATLWEEHLGESIASGDRLLTTLSSKIGASGFLDGAEVWIDGFASFMPQERSVLEEILKRAASVRVALLLDPARLEELKAGRRIDSMRLFAQSEETWVQLSAMARELDVEILEPRIFPEDAHPTRFSPSPALNAIESFFRATGFFEGVGIEGAMEAAQPRLPADWSAVSFVEAPSERDEIEAVARAIRRLVREEGHRYRDIALIARDLSSYAPHIRAVFARYSIPFFLDQRRSIGHHPLVRLVGAALRSIESAWRLNDVLDFLKNDLARVDRFTADRIENLAIRRGWRGRTAWMPEPKEAEDNTGLEIERHAALAPLAELEEVLSATDAIPASDFVRALTHFLETIEAPERIKAWAEAAKDSGDLDRAEEHVQAWEGVVALLAEITRTLENEALSLEEWADVLDTGLDGLTLGLVPPALDQVLVGTVERSRQPELRVAFVIGLNEGVFPLAVQPDPLLNDDERQRLQDQYGMELSATSDVRLFRERYLGYVALTRSSHRLWVSWAAANAKGTARAPSVFVGRLLRACQCSGAEAPTLVRLPREWMATDPLSIESPSDMAVFLARRNDHAAADTLRDLWRVIEKDAGLSGHTLRTPDPSVSLDAEALKPLLLPGGRKVSISRLETYNRCPFQFFAQYVLHLEERELHRINVMDMGTFHHELLARIFSDLAGDKDAALGKLLSPIADAKALDWGQVQTGDARAALDRALEAAAPELMEKREISENEKAFYLERSRKIIGSLLEGLIDMGRNDDFSQIGAEIRFGYSDAIDGLTLNPSGETPVLLRGVIDRVDVAELDGHVGVRIIDFKSSLKTLEIDEILAGLALQLPLYLLVILRQASDVVPVGMFFLDLSRSYQWTTAPGNTESSEQNEPIRLSGKFDLDHVDTLTTFDGKKARHVRLTMTNSGAPHRGAANDSLQDTTLSELCDTARRVAELTAADIRSACFDVQPQGKNSPCTWCPYSDFCRIDPRTTRVADPTPRIPLD